MLSKSIPQLGITRPLKFSATTSDTATNRRASSFPASVFIFREIEDFPAFQLWRWPNPRAVLEAGPPTTDKAWLDSTLITCAPWSASIRVAEGPACIQVKSKTLMPSRASSVMSDDSYSDQFLKLAFRQTEFVAVNLIVVLADFGRR